jgi:alpha-beta hydrolase superfamily lysophospholipase
MIPEGLPQRFGSGLCLHRHVFRPPGEPVAGMLFVHGLGDHLHRYASVGRLLASRGILGMGVDFPGHGRSPGRRGGLPGWDRLVEVLDDLVVQAREEIPDGTELGVFAHSFGAFLAVDYLARRPGLFRMAWLSSPLVDPARNQPRWLVRTAALLGAVAPGFPVDTGVRAALCREGGLPAEEGGGEEDERLIHHVVSAGFGAELLRRATQVRAAAGRLPADLSVLVTHGSEDRVCPASLSRELFGRMPCLDKRYVVVEGARHEPLHGAFREEARDAARAWLDGLGYPERGPG